MENEREQPDGNCYEGDGCPKEKAVLARQWREYRRALENIRAGMVDAPNQNIVDYIDAVMTPNVRVLPRRMRSVASCRRRATMRG